MSSAREAEPGAEPEVLGALSPSRAADFVSCPLAYRFRTVDRLPEAPSPAMARGTVVHRVLELLFDRPAPERTPQQAGLLLEPAWREALDHEPDLREVVAPEDEPAWLASCAEVLERWFILEDPQRLEPAGRELFVETVLDSRLLLRGVVDRVDVAPGGEVRIVDYKTGRAPRVGSEQRAFAQLRFYALVWWRLHGVVPSQLRLVYLGSGEVLTWSPDLPELEATQRRVEAIWAAISLARETGDWQPSPGPACGWCAHRALCPAYGGTPPPLPDPSPASAQVGGAGVEVEVGALGAAPRLDDPALLAHPGPRHRAGRAPGPRRSSGRSPGRTGRSPR